MSDSKVMLGLKMPTDPRWVNVVQKNLSEILTDHAWCEQKAASHAISTITRWPEYPEMVEELTKIAIEEMEHFGMVLEKIRERGFTLGFEGQDPYVRDLAKWIKKRSGSRTQQLTDSLLLAAMIEARSCERFRILSEEIEDDDLKKFYYDLMISEANHYTTFLKFAREYGVDTDVDQRWQDFLAFEATLMESYGKTSQMHG